MLVQGLETFVVRHPGSSGVPVLYLHGFGGSADSFAPLYPLVRSEQIALDLWGFGRSAEADGWSVFDYARKVIALLDALSIEKTDIIAHSFGGRIALVLAARFPTRIRRMVIADGAGIPPRRGFRYRWKVFWYKFRKKHCRHFDESRCGSPDYRSLSPGMKKTFVKVVNEDLREMLPAIEAPVLLVWGDRDRATPLFMAKVMEKGIRDAGLVIYAGCGHFAYLERAAEFAAAVNCFLK